ncbi:MAG: ABC transporter permease subunit [Clostridiales bacterium]|nr:ABC transporter permease subunit [Clostridiales bacterium]
MRAYIAFMKKEFRELTRTYKLLIMGILFFILGLMNPLTAKFTPDLLKNFMPEAIQITITEPVAMDSWSQFYKNVPQMGLIIFAIVFSGMISNELTKGTLVNMLTKGLSRKNVILAKFTSVGIVWTVSYFFCFAISYLYTKFFWSEAVPNLFFSVFCLWIFGFVIIALLLLGGVLLKSSYGSLLITAGVIGILFLINIVPTLMDYNPLMLSSSNTALLRQELQVSDFFAPLIVSVGMIVVSVIVSISVFNKKKL